MHCAMSETAHADTYIYEGLEVSVIQQLYISGNVKVYDCNDIRRDQIRDWLMKFK